MMCIVEDFMNKKPTDLVHPEASGFVERVTPCPPPDNVYFFKCTSCGHSHFRHAGYLQTMLPFMRSGGEKRVGLESYQVMVCVKCRRAYAWINEQMYDVTDQVDMKAWEKFEKEAQQATGPGGEC
jgi:hypothetical protein